MTTYLFMHVCQTYEFNEVVVDLLTSIEDFQLFLLTCNYINLLRTVRRSHVNAVHMD